MNTLNIAMAWHNLGIATIPIRAKSKLPALSSWKQFQTEMPRKWDLEAWFSGRYNLAVITGWRGLAVIDFDDILAYSCWATAAGADLLHTYRVQTRRGWHLYVFCRDAVETTCGDNWDIKAAGGYVLAPPSTHPSGHVYTAVGDPTQILTIDSVWDYLEKPACMWQPAQAMSASDPFDAAMRDNGDVGTSIDEIKARHSLHGMLGIPSNGRLVMIRCPLPGHLDSHESFAVYPDGHFHCFGCGARGDFLDAYSGMKQITLREAMRELAYANA